MKKDIFITESRRRTPWTDEAEDRTALQRFIDSNAEEKYLVNHKRLDLKEAELLNSYTPKCCPKCRSDCFQKYGISNKGINRYRCKKCNRTFSIITGTIFQNHKLPISEWIEFLLSLFRYQSFSSISKSNKNSYTTTKYWVSKVFLILKDYQENIKLSGKVYIDETFYKVRMSDIQFKGDGKEYRGLSRNQICIGIGCSQGRVVAFVEGHGKPTKEKTLATFKTHIGQGSTLIHDEERSHQFLVDELGLEEERYNSKLLKGIKDQDNPLDPINRQCRFLKRFLNAHSGFIRDDLQDYLNLFAFITNEDPNPYIKVEKLLSWSLSLPKTLTFRDKFSK